MLLFHPFQRWTQHLRFFLVYLREEQFKLLLLVRSQSSSELLFPQRIKLSLFLISPHNLSHASDGLKITEAHYAFNPFGTIGSRQSRTPVASNNAFDVCSILAILARRHDPEIDRAFQIAVYVAGHVDHLVRFPIAHVEGVRDDARARFEVA